MSVRLTRVDTNRRTITAELAPGQRLTFYYRDYTLIQDRTKSSQTLLLDAYQEQHGRFPFRPGQTVTLQWKTDPTTKRLIATSIAR